jgi:LruC domain-containing protein
MIIPLSFLFVFTLSCKKDNTTETPVEEKTMEQLIIPENFDFETTKEVTIQFQDQLKAGGMARYDVFYHSTQLHNDTITFINEDGIEVTEIVPAYDKTNDLIATKITETGFFNLLVNVPSYINELYVIKNELGVFTSSTIQINNKSAFFKSGLKSVNADSEVIYGVNNSGNIFTISPTTGVITMFDNLPVGSYGCAIDGRNNVLYYVGRNPKYPLYKYDLNTRTSTLIGNIDMKVQRLDYDEDNGLLYSSYMQKLYTIDPQNAKVVTTKEVEEIEKSEHGDIKKGPDGKWYLATYDRVYWLEFKKDKVYSHEVSDDDLPFKITGMTITSNGDIWLSTQNNHSQLVLMNKSNGSWQYKFSEFSIGIDDLSSTLLEQPPVVVDDTDGDGVIDLYDLYPSDPDRAYNIYTPSANSLGSLAFEDNWPSKGDYDFNDLVVDYQYKTVLNADDEVVEIYCKFIVTHIGGVYNNGFGFQLPFTSNEVASVTGYNITAGLVNLDAKGLETGQQNAVVIVFDNADDNVYSELNVRILLQNPMDAATFGIPPFNPFIFIDGDRSREAHQINMPPTNKINPAFFGTEDDHSIPAEGKYYLTHQKLPWTLHFLEKFDFPKEQKSINLGYKKFNQWAESGGEQYPDWYKDNPDYREPALLNVSAR